MQLSMTIVLLLALAASTPAQGAAAGAPLSKVIEMLTDLEAKVTSEGAEAKKAFAEFTDYCESEAANKQFAIKTGKAEVEELTADIADSAAQISADNTKIEKIAGDISADEADLAAATKLRESEKADFTAEEKELTETISMIERAIAILSREMAKGGAAMLQMQNTKNIAQVLGAMVQASTFSSADASRLTALVQNSQQTDDSDSDAEFGAPAAAAYKSKSGDIVSVLQDLLEKAEAQLAEAQKTEATSQNNFEMLKQSLTDEVKFANKDLSATKTSLHASSEAKATAEGDLSVTEASLKQDTADLASLKEDCLTGKETYEAETASRAEELKTIAKAIEVLKSTMPKSFLQFSSSSISSRADLINFEVVRYVRDLGRKQASPALTQLASRLATAIRMGQASGDDPFVKVKGLISDMIAKLQSERSEDDAHKAWCDENLAASTAKKEELEAEVEKLSTKIEGQKTKAAKLNEEVAALQKELADLAAQLSERSSLRAENKKAYTADKAEASLALKGIKSALELLRDYYGSGAVNAAEEGSSIISLLEVCESDFVKSLSEMEVIEAQQAASYEKFTKEAQITKATKEQDVKYKSKEAAGLAKTTAEDTSDLETIKAELSSVMEGLKAITDKCTYKVEPYAERKARREAEIAGLKEALSILEEQTVLLQQKSKKQLRGHH